MRLTAWILACGAATTLAGCSGGGAGTTTHPARTRTHSAVTVVTESVSATVPATRTVATVPAPAPVTQKPAPVLAGKVVGIDPGHNGLNYTDPGFIDHLVWNGRGEETCNTTGTETDGGYTEAQFNFNVATYLAADLRAEGAKVVLTRHNNHGVGPCVTTRAHIIDSSHANVAVDIHADGGPPGGRGFTILEPVADGPNDHVIVAARKFGRDLLTSYRALTGMPESTYDGTDGISFRSNLAGLNLTTVPEVLIECGNMRNATDAALLVTASFQRRAAKAIAQAITEFVTGRV